MRLCSGKQKTLFNNILIMTGMLVLTVLIEEGLLLLGLSNENLILLYILYVLVVARLTEGYLYGILAAVFGTFVFDYLVTEPRRGFSITVGFPVTLLFMLAVTLLFCAITTQLKASFAQQNSFRIDAEKEKMRGMLLRAISHDLRTPLTGIFSASSIIEEQAATLAVADIRRLSSDVKNNSEWLIRIVENLLAVTRISEGSVKVKKTMEAAEEIMAQSVTIVRKRFPDCIINVKAPDEPILVSVDGILISQVFINLLENAVKYSPPSSPVTFSLRIYNGCANFEVSDHGHGISTSVIGQLFETPIHQPEQSVDSISGIGIGLSICKTIIDAHGGVIAGANKGDGGAVFNVALPL